MRKGYAIAEMLVALAVLAVAATITAQIATWTVQERVKLENQDRALRLAENAIEEARLIPFADLTAEQVKWLKLPDAVHERYPDSTLTATLEPDEPRKRLTITVSLRSGKPVTLTAWRLP